MEMIYCKKWWFPRKKPIEILTEETAYYETEREEM